MGHRVRDDHLFSPPVEGARRTASATNGERVTGGSSHSRHRAIEDPFGSSRHRARHVDPTAHHLTGAGGQAGCVPATPRPARAARARWAHALRDGRRGVNRADPDPWRPAVRSPLRSRHRAGGLRREQASLTFPIPLASRARNGSENRRGEPGARSLAVARVEAAAGRRGDEASFTRD